MMNKEIPEKIIFFDGDCVFCNQWIRLIDRWDKNNIFHYSSLQSRFAEEFFIEKTKKQTHLESVIFYTSGELYRKSTAILKIVQQLGGLFNIVKIGYMIPKKWRDKWYDVLAKNRHKLMKNKPECPVHTASFKRKILINP